jgi:hypothetical protein
MNGFIRDGKGHVIGQKMINGTLLDGRGRLVGRYLSGCNTTLDNRGKFQGRGDQTLRLLNGNKNEK